MPRANHATLEQGERGFDCVRDDAHAVFHTPVVTSDLAPPTKL
jgi:hypothetical protein